MPGFFVVVEGPDGAGKTTITEAIVNKLRQLKMDIKQTREIGGTPMADELRKLVITEHDGEHVLVKTRALLAIAARLQHVSNVIGPCLKYNRVVVSDRFWMSTHVYQGLVEKAYESYQHHYQTVLQIEQAVGGGVDMMPDMIIHVTGDPIILHQRLEGKKKDHFESKDIDYHRKVNSMYDTLMAGLRDKTTVHTINTTRGDQSDIDATLTEIVAEIYRKHTGGYAEKELQGKLF
jgi:dTMP kinase